MLRDYQQEAVNAALATSEQRSIIVIATGGGKSHIISAIAEAVQGRVAIVAHRKELLEQNASKLNKDYGVFSAGLGGDDLESDIIVAGIQSIHNKDFEPFNYILYDECHRLPNNYEGQGWSFINKSPNAKLIGFTATPYRLQGGALGWGKIIYEKGYKELYERKFLSHITNKVKAELDLSKIEIVAGEYNEAMLSAYMSDPELIRSAVANIIKYTSYRYSVLIFCVTVMHGKLLTDAMQANGLQCAMISGDTPDAERKQTIEDFKDGSLKYLLNCQILIEGFDAPCTDTIVCLRPTKSKSLWEQMLGRGTRIFEGKSECLLLDMAGNLMEHGGIGTPYKEKARDEKLQPKGRICPSCEEYCLPSSKDCPECGFVFPEPEKRQASHNAAPDIENNTIHEKYTTFKVKGVTYSEHRSMKGSMSLKVSYIVPLYKYGVISEYLSPFHENDWVRGKVLEFFAKREHPLGSDPNTYSMDDLIWHAKQLKKPIEITVDIKEKFPKVVRYKYDEKSGGSSDSESSSELPEAIQF